MRKLEQIEDEHIEKEAKEAVSRQEKQIEQDEAKLKEHTNEEIRQLIEKSKKKSKHAINFIVKKFEEDFL